MNKQISLSDLQDELSQVKTNKKEFLAQMNVLIPWKEWISLVKPHYYTGKRGNKPYDLELMLRIHILQNLYDLSDDGVSSEVIDSRAFSDFCDISSSNQVPDGSTIGRFREILQKNSLQEQFFSQIVGELMHRGLILKKGTIVDSSLISAPSSTKNKEKKRDPDARSTKKGNQWHFGYKVNVGVDKKTGLIHTNKTTSANEHDVTVLHELLTGEENEIYGDSGYLGAENREDAIIKNVNGKKINYKINKRPSQSKNNSNASKAQIKRREQEKSSVRAKVEHVFAVIKRQLKFKKTRYRGLRKQIEKLNMMCALANLILADRPSLAV